MQKAAANPVRCALAGTGGNFGPMSSDLLTVVIASRNRPNLCARLARFLRKAGCPHPIVIANSSRGPEADTLKTLCDGLATVYSVNPDIDFLEKMRATIATITTPYVAMMPDDDITFPHAIEQCLSHLVENPEVTAAQGYVLGFTANEGAFDVQRVVFFAPSLDEDNPIRRLHQLIRRYQPYFWAVFRRDALLTAIQQAQRCSLYYFQETTLIATLALHGRFARLPCIYMLRGTEPSEVSLTQIHPFFAFLLNSEKFLSAYHEYREDLIEMINRDFAPVPCPPDQLRHMLNLLHLIYWRSDIHAGMMEHMVMQMLDPDFPRLVLARPEPAVRPFDAAMDVTVASARPGRRYIWRHEVLEPEPRNEISITGEERKRIIAALEEYDDV